MMKEMAEKEHYQAVRIAAIEARNAQTFPEAVDAVEHHTAFDLAVDLAHTVLNINNPRPGECQEKARKFLILIGEPCAQIDFGDNRR